MSLVSAMTTHQVTKDNSVGFYLVERTAHRQTSSPVILLHLNRVETAQH